MATKNITITLAYGELLYDLQNKTHLTARDRQDARHSAHMQSTDDEESLNAAKRYLTSALSMVRGTFSEWAHVDAVVSDDILSPKDMSGMVVYILPMPMNYNDGVTAALTSAMHRYIVHSAIADWMTDVSPDDAHRYSQLAEADLRDVRHALMARRRPDRRCCCHGGGGNTTPDASYLWLDNTLWQDNALWLEHS